MNRILTKTLFAFLTLTFLYSCKDDEVPLPDNLITFSSNEVGFSDSEQEIEIPLQLTRAVENTTTLMIDLTATGLTYGNEFTTLPEASNNSISVIIPAGSNEGIVKIIKKADVFLTGSESIQLKIQTASNEVLVGSTASVDIKFASIVSSGSTMQLNGIIDTESGSSAGNSVFVDLSNNQSSAVARSSWDLGFANSSDFRVIINNTSSATVKMVAKSDLNTVTAADTIPAASWSLGYTPESFDLIDDVSGDLSKTAMAAVSSTDADNKVYILNPGTGGGIAPRPWWKIRILRKGEGYTLQYARINATTFQSIDIAKNAEYHFKYVGLTSNATPQAALVSVEPKKANWDIKWSYKLYQTAFGADYIPYAFSDLIVTNTAAGVTAAEILTSDVSYTAFSEGHLTSLTFSSDPYAIGANWRVTSSSTESVGVRTDRFYVLKDSAGNVYKIKFISFHANDGGERGKPKFEYELVKKGS